MQEEDAVHRMILERLTEVFRDVFDDDAIVLNDGTSAADIPDWDSLTHVTLCVSVEKAFDTRLNAAEIGRLTNVGQLVMLLKRKKAQE